MVYGLSQLLARGNSCRKIFGSSWLVLGLGNQCFGSWWLVVARDVVARGRSCWFVVARVLF